jgi:hypothetical protein
VTVPETTIPTTTTQPMCNESTTTTEATTTTTFGEQGSTSVPVTVPETTSPTSPPTRRRPTRGGDDLVAGHPGQRPGRSPGSCDR